MLQDRYGLDISTSSAEARDRYVDAVDRMLAASPQVEAQLDAAIDADPGCAPGASTSPSINILTDGAALLWRSQLAGQPIDTTCWETLKDYYEREFPKPMVFVDAHAALPYAMLGQTDALNAYIDQIQSLGKAGRLPAGTMGDALSRAFAAFAAEQWSTCIDLLEPVMTEVVRIGGSRAQRDLVTNTLLAAYVKDGCAERARAFVSAVDDRRPFRPIAGFG